MTTCLQQTESTIRQPHQHIDETGHSLGGKYLTFLLAGEEYGLDILKVREIIGIMAITRMPQSQAFVKGVINLRGKVIPVIDLRLKFRLAPTTYDHRTCIIVVDIGVPMGIIVDRVQEVHDVPADEIEPPRHFGASVEADFILGMAKIKNTAKILLDIDRVLDGEDLVVMPGAPHSARLDLACAEE